MPFEKSMNVLFRSIPNPGMEMIPFDAGAFAVVEKVLSSLD
jgi:hypothetical protein